jgi:chitin deacetylase
LSARPSPAHCVAAWVANYPSSTPLANAVPQAWSAALNSAVQAGKIPNIPKTTVDPAAGPVYPAGTNGMDPTICSSTAKCRIDGDIWDAPTGVWGVGFDDGPIQGNSTKLYNFLQSKNQRATHFMIGVNILYDTEDFDFAFNTLKDDIAVHTWTHPYMTSLSNEDVVAQLGYTMQIIRDLTGGRLPRYWRPPYGDSDHRVRAIALEVFGLTTIIWNQE